VTVVIGELDVTAVSTRWEVSAWAACGAGNDMRAGASAINAIIRDDRIVHSFTRG
jgi:hypothetical protein